MAGVLQVLPLLKSDNKVLNFFKKKRTLRGLRKDFPRIQNDKWKPRKIVLNAGRLMGSRLGSLFSLFRLISLLDNNIFLAARCSPGHSQIMQVCPWCALGVYTLLWVVRFEIEFPRRNLTYFSESTLGSGNSQLDFPLSHHGGAADGCYHAHGHIAARPTTQSSSPHIWQCTMRLVWLKSDWRLQNKASFMSFIVRFFRCRQGSTWMVHCGFLNVID